MKFWGGNTQVDGASVGEKTKKANKLMNLTNLLEL